MAASGVELATAWVRLTFSADGAQDAIMDEVRKAPVDQAGDDAGKRYSTGFGTAAKAGLAAAAGLAVAGVVAVFKTGMDELKFGEQISAQTDQLIANTGAGFTTSWVEDYTLALSKVSGVAEEDLQAAGNKLLEFGITNEDVYKRAVDGINNIGAKTGDVSTASTALSKALQDPATAAGALRRAGIALTEEQQALIATMMEQGDVAGAQAVILDQVEATYGGMAEAAGGTTQGAINKLTNTFENLAGSAVETLLPAITGLATGLTGFFDWVGQNQWVLPVLATAIGVLLVAAFIAWTASIWAANVALLANPITWIILAIVALIAIIILLVLNWDTVVAFLTDVWNGFVSWFTAVMDGFLGWWNGLWTAVWEWIVSVWNGIVSAVTGFFQGLWNTLISIGVGIIGWWNGLWSGIVSFFGGIWNGIISTIQTVQGVFGSVFSAIAGIVRGAFEGVVGIVRGVINGIIGAVNGVIDGINGVAGAIGSAIGVNLKVGKIPMLAEGGTITRSGTVLVGERGPELLHLPRGASVDPDIANVGVGGRPVVVQQFIQDDDPRLFARRFGREFEAVMAGEPG